MQRRENSGSKDGGEKVVALKQAYAVSGGTLRAGTRLVSFLQYQRCDTSVTIARSPTIITVKGV